MPSELHESQNKQAAKWLKKQGFGVVATNIKALESREIIDVIGFRTSCSIVIESKVSRADFFADFKKPERKEGAAALGLYRAYICPVGLIKKEEVPKGWILLYSNGKKIVEEIKPKGNHWPSSDYKSQVGEEWKPYQHKINEKSERSMLYSLCRRLVMGEKIER